MSLSYQKYRSGIRARKKPIPEPGSADPGSRVKKAPDPESGPVYILAITSRVLVYRLSGLVYKHNIIGFCSAMTIRK